MAQYVDERGDIVSTARKETTEPLTPREARQGRLGRPVLYVLVGGILLACVAWAAAEFWGESAERNAPGVTTTTTSTTPGSAPAASTVANQPTGNGTFDNNVPAGTQQTAPVDRDPTPESGTGGASQTVTPDGTAP